MPGGWRTWPASSPRHRNETEAADRQLSRCRYVAGNSDQFQPDRLAAIGDGKQTAGISGTQRQFGEDFFAGKAPHPPANGSRVTVAGVHLHFELVRTRRQEDELSCENRRGPAVKK